MSQPDKIAAFCCRCDDAGMCTEVCARGSVQIEPWLQNAIATQVMLFTRHLRGSPVMRSSGNIVWQISAGSAVLAVAELQSSSTIIAARLWWTLLSDSAERCAARMTRLLIRRAG